MNKSEALAKLSKLLGPNTGYRVDPKAPRAADRETIRANAKVARVASDAADAALRARRAELLAADPTYQRLKAEAAALSAASDEARGGLHRHRVTVGRSSGMFFHIKAQGDTWAEVVAKVEGRAS